MTPEQKAKVRELNDALRSEMKGGRWVYTQGIQASGLLNNGLLAMVAKFEAFTENNDPHGEHDMGMIEVGGEVVMWKIDTYESAECVYGADEPWNPDNSYRVLTILLASEY